MRIFSSDFLPGDCVSSGSICVLVLSRRMGLQYKVLEMMQGKKPVICKYGDIRLGDIFRENSRSILRYAGQRQ